MAPAPDNLAPAGSSTYSSNTLTVGDGTWDSTRNTFLLPNLVGLNFETMQYNGTASPAPVPLCERISKLMISLRNGQSICEPRRIPSAYSRPWSTRSNGLL